MIEFEPLRKEHLSLLREWLGRPHVRPWWRDSIEESIREYEQAIAGLDPSDHYLIVVDERPIGMIETYVVSDHPEWEAIVQVGEGVAGVDLLIGEADLTGRGLGPRVLAGSSSESSSRAPGRWLASPQSTKRTGARCAHSRKPASPTSGTSRRRGVRTA